MLKSLQYNSQNDICDIILQLISAVDQHLTLQLNEILHHPAFLQLEASWRGLYYLTNETIDIYQLKIRLLDVNWEVLSKDVNYALEFDQSQLFKLIYTNEFDLPGGEPFGLLIGDYYINHSAATVQSLARIASVAAAAFAPFLIACDPNFFGVDDFSDLRASINLNRIFEQLEYYEWKKLRALDDTRFMGIVLPRVLLRLPYNLNETIHPFCFKEITQSSADYLWGNAAYCLAAVICRAYEEQGWFAEIRGTAQNKMTKGLVAGLPRQSLPIGNAGLNYKPVTEVVITGAQEKTLSELGFIALCECQYTPFSAFYSCQSIQTAKVYDHKNATSNATISAMLHYLLCISRFAHYIKIMMRNKIGVFLNPDECESFLRAWLLNYTAVTDGMSAESKAKYPLKDARIKVEEQSGKPGSYYCVMQLQPHFQLDNIEAQLTLLTEIPI